MKLTLIGIVVLLTFSGCTSTGHPRVLNDNKVDFLNLLKVDNRTYYITNAKDTKIWSEQ